MCRAKIIWVALVAGMSGSAASAAPPEDAEVVVHKGEPFSISRTVTVPALPQDGRRIDVLFLSDNTGSMSPVIQSVKRTAHYLFAVLANLDQRFDGRNFAYGVAHYVGDPSEGVNRQQAYVLQLAITKDEDTVVKAIDGWFAIGGGDEPESNFFALHQIATDGAAVGDEKPPEALKRVAWRKGAKRIILWFGDAPSHPLTIANGLGTVRLDEARDALSRAGIILAAMNTRTKEHGIDAEGQATALIRDTGGILVNNITANSLAEDVLNILDDLTTPSPFVLYPLEEYPDIVLEAGCSAGQPCPESIPGQNVEVTITGNATQVGSYRLKYGLTGFNGAVTSVLLKVIE